jgi:hypothetical protein
MSAEEITLFARRRTDPHRARDTEWSVPVVGSAGQRPQEIYDRLMGTRAELDVRIERVLEQILRLRLDGQDAAAHRKIRSMCDTLDHAIDTVTVLTILEYSS